MSMHAHRDLMAGAMLCALGTFVALYCWSHYRIGTLTAMGPGMFPTALGIILALIGAAMAAVALLTGDRTARIEVRPALAILASVSVFAASLPRLGLIPTIFLLTFVAGLADEKLRPRQVVLLATVLSVIGTLLFPVGLRLPIPIAQWPF